MKVSFIPRNISMFDSVTSKFYEYDDLYPIGNYRDIDRKICNRWCFDKNHSHTIIIRPDYEIIKWDVTVDEIYHEYISFYALKGIFNSFNDPIYGSSNMKSYLPFVEIEFEGPEELGLMFKLTYS